MGNTARTKVLLVESDQDLRDEFREILEFEGYQPVCASSHLEALACLRSEELPELILFDCAPPCRVGHEFLEEIRRMDGAVERIPILLVFSDAVTRKKFDDARAAEFLSKPLDLEILVAAVHRLAESRRHAA